jgi:hypothetical protein
VKDSDRITPAAPLDVVAVTSRLPEPLPNDQQFPEGDQTL